MKPILAIYFLAATSAYSGGPLFSHMEDGDKVEVTEHSTGCFHDRTSYYEIGKSHGGYSFSEYAITWDKSAPPRILKKETIGRIVLSRKDVEGLDALLKFYRAKKEVYSTTQVSLFIHYFEPGGLVKVERLKDGSGGYGLDGRKSVVTFYALTKRFQTEGSGQSANDQPATSEESKSEGVGVPNTESEGRCQ